MPTVPVRHATRPPVEIQQEQIISLLQQANRMLVGIEQAVQDLKFVAAEAATRRLEDEERWLRVEAMLNELVNRPR